MTEDCKKSHKLEHQRDEQDIHREPSVYYVNLREEPTQYANVPHNAPAPEPCLQETTPHLYDNRLIHDPSGLRISDSNPIYSCVTEDANRTIFIE